MCCARRWTLSATRHAVMLHEDHMSQTPDDKTLYRISGSFNRQSAMTTIGARLKEVGPGRVVIELPMADHVLQQNSFVHGGVIGMIADSACGYAALTMFGPEKAVLTTEYKIHFLSPAMGDRFEAEGRVIRPGRLISVVQGDVYAFRGDEKKHVAVMLATMMSVEKTPGMVD